MTLPRAGWMPQNVNRFLPPLMSGAGKGFGGGEATRDPAPTEVDPNDPKGKQQAIHKAESFSDYLKRRQVEMGGALGADFEESRMMYEV